MAECERGTKYPGSPCPCLRITAPRVYNGHFTIAQGTPIKFCKQKNSQKWCSILGKSTVNWFQIDWYNTQLAILFQIWHIFQREIRRYWMRCCPFEENWCAVKKIPIFIGFGTSSTFYKGHLEVWKSMKVLHWLLLTSKEDSPGCCNLLHTCSAKCKLKSGHQIFQHTRIYQVRLYALETPEKRKFFTRERYTATQRLKIQCGKWFA